MKKIFFLLVSMNVQGMHTQDQMLLELAAAGRVNDATMHRTLSLLDFFQQEKLLYLLSESSSAEGSMAVLQRYVKRCHGDSLIALAQPQLIKKIEMKAVNPIDQVCVINSGGSVIFDAGEVAVDQAHHFFYPFYHVENNRFIPCEDTVVPSGTYRLSPQGKLLAHQSLDSDQLRIWDTYTGKLNFLKFISPQSGECIISNTDAFIMLESKTSGYELLDATSGQPLFELTGAKKSNETLKMLGQFSLDDRYIITGLYTNMQQPCLGLWGTTEKKLIRKIEGNNPFFNQDGSCLAVCNGIAIQVYDSRSGDLINSLAANHHNLFNSITFSASNRYLLTQAQTARGTCFLSKIWDLPAQKAVYELHSPTAIVFDSFFGLFVIYKLSEDQTPEGPVLYNVINNLQIPLGNRSIAYFKFDPTSTFLISALNYEEVELRHAPTGNAIGIFPHSMRIGPPVFSKTGTRLITFLGKDRFVWELPAFEWHNISTAEQIAALIVHSNRTKGEAMSRIAWPILSEKLKAHLFVPEYIEWDERHYSREDLTQLIKEKQEVHAEGTVHSLGAFFNDGKHLVCQKTLNGNYKNHCRARIFFQDTNNFFQGKALYGMTAVNAYALLWQWFKLQKQPGA